MTEHDRAMLALITRSPDVGDRWRQVSTVLWPLVTKLHPELRELDEENLRVRLSADGEVVVRHMP
jgi:hypothetical protein